MKLTEQQYEQLFNIENVRGIVKDSKPIKILLEDAPSEDLLKEIRKIVGSNKFLVKVVGDIKLL